MHFQEVKELIQAMSKSTVTHLELEMMGVKLSLRKDGLGYVKEELPSFEVPIEVSVMQSEEKSTAKVASVKEKEICAPMVGTFYRAPSPNSPPFVAEGDEVKIGQSLCIIEAMKLMNEIEAEETGRITQILVENGEVVEYGQRLFLLESKG